MLLAAASRLLQRRSDQLCVRALATFAATRNDAYAILRHDDIRYFQQLLGEAGVVTDQNALHPYNRDWMGKYEGSSKVALKPTTVQQVAGILAHCNRRRLAVVPQGGNTGLVGGSVPVFDEVVLSTVGLNKILSFDDVSGVLVCQAGCILETLDKHVGQRGYMMPLDLGAKGSCCIGGNVSTNAGGLRLLRYGSMRGTVLGLEACLADGTVVDTLQTLRKDNTGYDLKQLFIGGEGTLGVVTAVSILCPPKPSSVHVTFLACPSFPAVLSVFKLARRKLGEVLSAYEFLDRAALEIVLKNVSSVKNPMPEEHTPFYLVVETSGSNKEHDYAKLEGFLEEAYSEGLIANGVIAQDSSQAASIWHLRESISEGLRLAGRVYKYDLSLPVSEIYDLVEETRQRLMGMPATVVGYGHLGDGNLHLNVSTPAYDAVILEKVEPFVYEWTAARRGSISAEHGLGQMKAESIGYTKSRTAVELMGQIKNLLDPKHILNPYKMLPQAVVTPLKSQTGSSSSEEQSAHA